MPKNKQETIIFTTLMCLLMVTGMSGYNLIIRGGWNQDFLSNLLGGLIPGFAIALSLDLWVVGPVAKKIAFKFSFTLNSPLHTVMTISICMISGMVLCMSLFGLIIEGGLDGNFLLHYLQAVGKNFIFALPLQLLFVGPLSRKVLALYQQR